MSESPMPEKAPLRAENTPAAVKPSAIILVRPTASKDKPVRALIEAGNNFHCSSCCLV